MEKHNFINVGLQRREPWQRRIESRSRIDKDVIEGVRGALGKFFH
jgi:hypothetical protein